MQKIKAASVTKMIDHYIGRNESLRTTLRSKKRDPSRKNKSVNKQSVNYRAPKGTSSEQEREYFMLPGYVA